jgi:hypothetical protein
VQTRASGDAGSGMPCDDLGQGAGDIRADHGLSVGVRTIDLEPVGGFWALGVALRA